MELPFTVLKQKLLGGVPHVLFVLGCNPKEKDRLGGSHRVGCPFAS